MKLANRHLAFVVITAVVLPVASLYAAADAADNANNYGTDYNNQNLGTGFGSVYVLTNSSNNSSNGGTFIGNSTANGGGSSGGINTNNKAFGLYANGGALTQVTRAFGAGGSNNSAALASGQVFSLALDNGYINSGSVIGINLLNASGTAQVTFQFTGGNADYFYRVGTGTLLDTGIPYTTGGLTLGLAEGNNDAFNLVVTSGSTTATLSGTAGSDISQFQVFNNNAGSGANYDLYFNSPMISDVPELSAWAMMPLFLGLLGVARWFRHAHSA